MNILQINTMDKGGGAAKVCLALKRSLEVVGHKTSLFVKLKYSDESNIFIAKWPNPLVRLVKKITGKDVGSFLSNKVRPFLANDIDFFKTDRILKTKEFKEADIIHCHNLHGNYFKLETLVKMSLLKPIVWTLHDVWAITPHCGRIYSDEQSDGFFKCPNAGYDPRLMWDNEPYLKKKKRKLYEQLKDIHLVVPSNWLMEKVKKSVLGDKNISLIYNGIDTEVFKPGNKADARTKLSLPENKKIILFLSAIGADGGKGWNYVKKAIEKYSGDNSVMFICIGRTNQANDKSPGNVLFLDYIKDEQKIAKYFTASDIVLFPSLAESFGLVAAEALASGIPAVVFQAGGIPEIIRHKENGYVADYGNKDDLLRGIEYIFNLRDEEKKVMSDKSREKALKLFDQKIMVADYLELYQKVLTAKKNG